MDDLLSPQQLADYLGLSVGSIYGMNYSRTGPPAIKVGRQVRYRRSDVEQWLDANVKAGR